MWNGKLIGPFYDEQYTRESTTSKVFPAKKPFLEG